MKNDELLVKAENLAGGVRPLARAISVNPGLVALAKQKNIIPPRLAMKLALYCGENESAAYFEALEERAEDADERKVIRGALQRMRRGVACVAILAFSLTAVPQPSEARSIGVSHVYPEYTMCT